MPTLFEDDLQSVVQMGFGQIQQESFHGNKVNFYKITCNRQIVGIECFNV